jgi:hypothetical protein
VGVTGYRIGAPIFGQSFRASIGYGLAHRFRPSFS